MNKSKNIILKKTLFFTLLVILSGCGSKANFAPITRAKYRVSSDKIHVVGDKETIYAIAWRYDLDYRDLIKLNNLALPYRIVLGQKLKLNGKTDVVSHKVKKQPAKPKVVSSKVKKQKQYPKKIQSKKVQLTKVKQISSKKLLSRRALWIWPAKGARTSYQRSYGRSFGIDIYGKKNSSIVASADGIVVYNGNNLRGYGNLIIIKHNSEVLSAYAYNNVVLVKEGERVKRGQKIASMGEHAGKSVLHFELRKAGKPVNPLLYLPN